MSLIVNRKVSVNILFKMWLKCSTKYCFTVDCNKCLVYLWWRCCPCFPDVPALFLPAVKRKLN